MKNNYLKQAWSSIRQQPVVCAVSITGTALAIFLIMVVVMISEMGVAPFAPESNRDRWLIHNAMSISNDDGNNNNGGMAFNMAKAVFYEMKVPETATIFGSWNDIVSISVPGKSAFGAERRDVDANYWKVMDFTFIDGKPFNQADFDAASTLAVISESLARRLYGSTDVTGREILVNHASYRVCGVVKDVTNLATYAYAEVWLPLTTTYTGVSSWNTWMGPMMAIMLAKSADDFNAIREEYNTLFDKLDEQNKATGYKSMRHNRPYTQEVLRNNKIAWKEPDHEGYQRRLLLVYMILLIVPAVNLSSMTQSRLQQRTEEIGVRRAFGATRLAIIKDMFLENLMITLMAGLIGLALSLIFLILCGAWIVTPASTESISATGISISVLFHWSTFGMALLFCFVLNVLSAGLPAWRASRINIVDALK